MAQFLIYVRRHWQAMLVSIFFLWRLRRGDFEFNLAMWIAVGLAVVGMVMYLAVILINRGMPAGVTPEEIPEDVRPCNRQSEIEDQTNPAARSCRRGISPILRIPIREIAKMQLSRPPEWFRLEPLYAPGCQRKFAASFIMLSHAAQHHSAHHLPRSFVR